MSVPRITVLLADDHTIVLEGLRALLQSERDIEVVGEAATGREAVRLAKALMPDVVLMDIAMSQLNGLEAARQISRAVPSTRVLILSSYCDDEYVDQATASGPVPSGQPRQGAERRVQSTVGITGPTLNARLIVDMPGQPGQSGDLLHRLRETGPIPPRAGQAEGRHPDHDCSRIRRRDGIPVETERFQHPRREVFDHHV